MKRGRKQLYVNLKAILAPYKKYWEGEACALCSYAYGIEYSWLRFWRRKEVDYMEAGPQVFWNRVVDYIVWVGYSTVEGQRLAVR